MVLGHRRLIKKKMQDKRNIVYTVQDLKPAFNVNISSEKVMLYQLLLLWLRILNSQSHFWTPSKLCMNSLVIICITFEMYVD